MSGEYFVRIKVDEEKLNGILDRLEKARIEIQDCAWALQDILSGQIGTVEKK